MRCLPDYLQQYSNSFGKIGCLKGKHHIIVDREVPPVVIPLRHIPVPFKIKLNEELDRMGNMEIITPIEDWSLVILKNPIGNCEFV